MQRLRLVFGILLIIPLFLLMDATLLHPANYETGSLGELAFMIFGIPILTFNMWAWVHPEILEFYFLGQEGIQPPR